jgi:hypothetical protein
MVYDLANESYYNMLRRDLQEHNSRIQETYRHL